MNKVYPPTRDIPRDEPVKAISCLKEIDFFTIFCNGFPGLECAKRWRIESGAGLLKHPIRCPSEVNRKREHVEQNGALLLGIIPKYPPRTPNLTQVESDSAVTGFIE